MRYLAKTVLREMVQAGVMVIVNGATISVCQVINSINFRKYLPIQQVLDNREFEYRDPCNTGIF